MFDNMKILSKTFFLKFACNKIMLQKDLCIYVLMSDFEKEKVSSFTNMSL